MCFMFTASPPASHPPPQPHPHPTIHPPPPSGSAWSPAAFAALRDCTVAEAACALASAGRLQALPVLLARHPRALLPSILDVLGAAPETLDAKQLAPLLRQVRRAGLGRASPLCWPAAAGARQRGCPATLLAVPHTFALSHACALAPVPPPGGLAAPATAAASRARLGGERGHRCSPPGGGAVRSAASHGAHVRCQPGRQRRQQWQCWRWCVSHWVATAHRAPAGGLGVRAGTAAGRGHRCEVYDGAGRAALQVWRALRPFPPHTPARCTGRKLLPAARLAARPRSHCLPAGQLPNALALLEAGAAALHYGQPSVSALLALGQELLSLIKLGAPVTCACDLPGPRLFGRREGTLQPVILRMRPLAVLHPRVPWRVC